MEPELNIEVYKLKETPRLALTIGQNNTGYTTIIIQGEEYLNKIKDSIEDILQEN